VIVFQNLGLPWYPRWHYAVVIGYDLPRREVLLHSGPEARKVTSMRLFELTWEWGKNWGVVVLPPEKLPATAEEELLVRALARKLRSVDGTREQPLRRGRSPRR